MPEYLSPTVYIEEVDSGSKPIEGVSTSTSGMIGVTERGPVGVPILITSWGEYRRWFGDMLSADLYGDHRFLPHGIEGFFTNAGRRVYVTRVLSLEASSSARTRLFRHLGDDIGGLLLARAEANALEVAFVTTGSPITVTTNKWIRLGSGSDAEYRQAAKAPTTPSTHSIVSLSPFQRTYPVGATVERQARPAAPSTARKLVGDHPAGSMTLELTGGAASISKPDSLLQLVQSGPPAIGEEFVCIDIETDLGGGTSFRVDLQTPLQFDHVDGEAASIFAPLAPAAAADTTTLLQTAVAGESVLIGGSNTKFATLTDLIRIVDGKRSEVRQVGKLHNLELATPVMRAIPAGASVQHVTTADATIPKGGKVRILAEQTVAGAMAFSVDDRNGLQVGDVLRVGLTLDPDVEYAVIRDLPARLSGGAFDPGRVVLVTPLARPHGGATPATKSIVCLQAINAASEAAALVHPVAPGAEQTLISAPLINPPTATDLARIRVGSGDFVFARISAAKVAPVQALTFKTALLLPHAAPQPILVREELLDVFALDPGAWGNRLRVAARRDDTPLVRSRIRSDASGIQDSTHIRLDSAAGVEPGTILSLADATGAPIDAPFKVEAIDRQNGYLLTLSAALPAAAVLGASIVSIEFALGVYLLRQPDPGQPARNSQLLDSEIFRHLSLDPRHSGYVHRVIGTTWTPGAAGDVDDDGRPLRRADRRSEGGSGYIRVRDIAQDDPGPTKKATLESIRLGPEFLIDILPDGRREAARRPLEGGDDQTAALTDDDYIGVDDANADRRTGLNALRNFEEISIVAAPGRTSVPMQSALISHCELMRYRFAVLDAFAPPDDSLADVQAQRQQFDTKYASIYHPWLLIPDPYPPGPGAPPEYPIPPSGHVVGIYARTDVERGVHKAPANEVVRGVLGLQRLLTRGEHDVLNPYPVNINVIRDFRPDNRGIRVYGGRVITSDSDWKYVNVRRLMIFIEASLDRGLQWAVFEPNAEPLWARVRRSISNFLTLLWRNGALEGAKVEEAFFVKCDRTTMTQNDIDSGRLISVVGVAPVKPAEFVIVRIGLWTAHADE